MLEPLRFPPSSFFGALPLEPVSSRREAPVAPAPSSAPLSFMPSMTAASMSSSLGYSCSARSYLREFGRKTSVATWLACVTSMPNFLGTSRLMVISLWTRLSEGLLSYQQRPFHQPGGPQVAV